MKRRRLSSAGETDPGVFRVGGVSYLRIPAGDARRLATFYEAVFGWSVRSDRDEPSFADGSRHVIGHFTTDQAVAGEAGVRPYIHHGLEVEDRRAVDRFHRSDGVALILRWVHPLRRLSGSVVVALIPLLLDRGPM